MPGKGQQTDPLPIAFLKEATSILGVGEASPGSKVSGRVRSLGAVQDAQSEGDKYSTEKHGGRAGRPASPIGGGTPDAPRPAGGELPPSAPEAAHLTRRRRTQEGTPGRGGPKDGGKFRSHPTTSRGLRQGRPGTMSADPNPAPLHGPALTAAARPRRDGRRQQPDSGGGSCGGVYSAAPEAVALGQHTCVPARLLRRWLSAGGGRGADGGVSASFAAAPRRSRAGPAAPWRRSACPAPGQWGALRGRRSPSPGMRRREGGMGTRTSWLKQPPPSGLAQRS